MILLKNKIQNEKSKQILIFDTNIFLIGINFNLIDADIYTTPKVIEEVRHKDYINKNRNILIRIQAAIENKKLLLRFPSGISIQKVEDGSKITGDYKALSMVDKELIALALELRESLNKEVTLYSNDFSIQNLCSELNIPFSSLIRKGIKSRIIWEVYCPFCKEKGKQGYKAEDLNNFCEICGSKLVRRPKK